MLRRPDAGQHPAPRGGGVWGCVVPRNIVPRWGTCPLKGARLTDPAPLLCRSGPGKKQTAEPRNVECRTMKCPAPLHRSPGRMGGSGIGPPGIPSGSYRTASRATRMGPSLRDSWVPAVTGTVGVPCPPLPVLSGRGGQQGVSCGLGRSGGVLGYVVPRNLVPLRGTCPLKGARLTEPAPLLCRSGPGKKRTAEPVNLMANGAC